ncbi:MAG: V-type ATP synthase subunit E [Oscillospiraceae bacterium]|nr:V-type ATP synthase subunit E [Oscillospiraceae bacterium]
MDGIETITARILQDNEAEIRKLTEQSQAQAAEIEARYAAEATALSEEILRKGKRAAEDRKERLSGAAQIEIKKNVLAMKQSLLEQAFQRALSTLTSLPEDEYAALLVNLAVSNTRIGQEQLIFSQADRTRYGKKVVTAANSRLEQAGRTAKLTLSETVRSMKGGLILRDGQVEVNCTFETILRLMRRDSAHQVAALLFQ